MVAQFVVFVRWLIVCRAGPSSFFGSASQKKFFKRKKLVRKKRFKKTWRLHRLGVNACGVKHKKAKKIKENYLLQYCILYITSIVKGCIVKKANNQDKVKDIEFFTSLFFSSSFYRVILCF
jgi:hypothetical protein